MDYVSLFGTDLADADLRAANLFGSKVWLTTLPMKEDVAWANFDHSEVRAPTEKELDWVRRALSAIGDPSWPTGKDRLGLVLQRANSGSSDEDFEMEVWKNWSSNLSRQSDNSYRDTYSHIVAELACHNSNYATAIEQWTKPPEIYDEYVSGAERGFSMPTDASFAKLTDDRRTYHGRDLGYVDYRFEFFPSWVNLRLLADKLHKPDECSAVRQLSPNAISALERNIQQRVPENGAQ